MSGYNYFNGSSTENYLAYRDQSLFSALGEGRGGRIFGGITWFQGKRRGDQLSLTECLPMRGESLGY